MSLFVENSKMNDIKMSWEKVMLDKLCVGYIIIEDEFADAPDWTVCILEEL